MEELTARLVDSLVGVGTERISLSLDEIRREASGSEGVVERECGRGRGDRDSCSDRSADRPAPSRLGLCHGIAEEPLEEEIREVGIRAIRRGDGGEEPRPDDASGSPERGDGAGVEAPTEFIGRCLDQHETLGVGDDLRRVQRILEIRDHLVGIVVDRAVWSRQDGRRCGALVDENSRLGRKPGDPKSTDPGAEVHQFYTQSKASGGFLRITVGPATEATHGSARFTFVDNLGKVLYETEKVRDVTK